MCCSRTQRRILSQQSDLYLTCTRSSRLVPKALVSDITDISTITLNSNMSTTCCKATVHGSVWKLPSPLPPIAMSAPLDTQLCEHCSCVVRSSTNEIHVVQYLAEVRLARGHVDLPRATQRLGMLPPHATRSIVAEACASCHWLATPWQSGLMELARPSSSPDAPIELCQESVVDRVDPAYLLSPFWLENGRRTSQPTAGKVLNGFSPELCAKDSSPVPRIITR